MREIKLGLLGLGTVGSGVIEIIRRRENDWLKRFGVRPVVKKILVRDLTKARSIPVDSDLLTTRWEELIADPEIEVIVEVMGGEEPAHQIAVEAIRARKHLVTANKLMLALHGPELFALAQKNGVEIAFEASVGGGIPIIQPLRESLNANAIESMIGIINGTTNYILTAMAEQAASYYDVLERAQALGYAEADPSADVEGYDARYKLSVLTGVAFGEQLPVEVIATGGISAISLTDLQLAEELGYAIKLVAKAQRTPEGGIRGHVHPTLVPVGHPLSQIHGVNNALLVSGDAVGDVLFAGPGAGMMATGSAVTSDLIRLCRIIATNQPAGSIAPVPVFTTGTKPTDMHHFFITIQTTTQPDVAKIAVECVKLNIPIDSIFSKDTGDLFMVGILTGLTGQQEIIQFKENLSIDRQFRKIIYFYVERR